MFIKTSVIYLLKAYWVVIISLAIQTFKNIIWTVTSQSNLTCLLSFALLSLVDPVLQAEAFPGPYMLVPLGELCFLQKDALAASRKGCIIIIKLLYRCLGLSRWH